MTDAHADAPTPLSKQERDEIQQAFKKGLYLARMVVDSPQRYEQTVLELEQALDRLRVESQQEIARLLTPWPDPADAPTRTGREQGPRMILLSDLAKLECSYLDGRPVIHTDDLFKIAKPVEQAASPSSVGDIAAEDITYLRSVGGLFARVADVLTEQAATLQRLREQQEKLVETLTVEANRPMPSDAAFDVEVKEHAHGYRMGVGKALMLLKGLA